MHGCMRMVLMSSTMLALTGVKLYSPNSFLLLQMTPLILIHRTGSSSNSNRVND